MAEKVVLNNNQSPDPESLVHKFNIKLSVYTKNRTVRRGLSRLIQL